MKKKNFTFLELMIVIAVIGLLISILLPSLRSAKEASSRAVCMSNLSQIYSATTMYSKDWGKFWNSNNRPYTRVGKSGTRYGQRVTSRLLNKYLGYTTDGTEVEVAKCPSDEYFKDDRRDITAYDLLGSSYCDNMAGNTIRRRGGSASKSLKGKGFQQVVSPEKCLLYMEWPIVSQAYRPDEPFPAWHKKDQFFNVVMVSGSVKYIRVLPRQVSSDNYHFAYDR